MAKPGRPCASCHGDLNILAALRAQPRPHGNTRYCSVSCRKAAERRRVLAARVKAA